MAVDYQSDETTMKILIALVLIALSVSASAADKFDLYKCTEEQQLSSCNKCLKLGVEVSFLAAINNNFVLRQDDRGETITLDNCQIFDSKNWNCSSNYSDPSFRSTSKKAMISGTYRSKVTMEQNGKSKLYLMYAK